MAVIVSIEILLPINLTNTRSGKIACYNKESVNNTVQCPEEDSKLVTDCLDGGQREGAVVIILFNSIEIFHVVPLFMWACNSIFLLIFLTPVSFRSHTLSISYFVRTQKANLLHVAPSISLNLVHLAGRSLDIYLCLTVPPSLQPIT